MPKMTNPLRYPGGKQFLVSYVVNLLKSNDLVGTTFHEPFAGSAAISIGLLNQELIERAILIERDPLIYSFWRSVIHQPEELCARIDDLELNIETWNNMSPLRNLKAPLGNLLELGLAGLFFSRTNYSGIIMANPLGGKNQKSVYTLDCRFNKKRVKEQIMLVARFRDRITVEWTDAIRYLRRERANITQANHFVYVDPPYYEKGQSLYRCHFHDEDHRNLAELLHECYFPWLLSYDNHTFIQKLYFGQADRPHHHEFHMDSFIKSRSRGAELLISNLEIPPIERISRAIQVN